jgi:dienelactone hydrolase
VQAGVTTIRHRSAVRLAAAAMLVAGSAAAQDAPPERVSFPSADGRTTLTGYLFTPDGKRDGRMPAVVMMHGRAGAYSSLAKGRYDASTLSQRHRMWGRLWAEQGYLAMLVDGFGPRGHPQGFARGSYKDRPADLDEVTVRPLDAYGALAYMRSRPDVAADRIGLMGWSNGGSATLASMAPDVPGIAEHTPAAGFRAAISFYPGCGLKHRFDGGFKPYAPVRVLIGTADEEVSPKICQQLVERSRAQGGDIEIKLYPGAQHSFDDPGSRRQGVAANANATADSKGRAERFFAEQLGK